jgi:ATP-dependent DNA helicase RecQ
VDTEDSARTALQRVGVAVAPRALWPTGLERLDVREDGKPVKGRIAPEYQVAEGRAVARLTDLGYGNVLRDLFAPDADGNPRDVEVPPDLARACLQVLKEWGWDERPGAVAWVPSVDRPTLVESLASGIASAGRLQLLGPLGLSGAPGSASANSAFRVRDLWQRFEVPSGMAESLRELPSPVLLVDDLIDSRWTMTVAGRLLRRAGARAVLPFALASVA